MLSGGFFFAAKFIGIISPSTPIGCVPRTPFAYASCGGFLQLASHLLGSFNGEHARSNKAKWLFHPNIKISSPLGKSPLA